MSYKIDKGTAKNREKDLWDALAPLRTARNLMAERVEKISKIIPERRPKPGPRTQLPRFKVRDRCVTAALNDEEVAALDVFRKAHAVISMPTRSAFVAWIIRQWIEANRRKDVPGVAPKRVPVAQSRRFTK
jgi:hypothetical protein